MNAFTAMSVIVLSVVVLIYWAYCIYWGFKGWHSNKVAIDYFLAGRSLSFWNFVFATTATCFSGWTFISHPGVIFTDGFSAGYASFYAIAIPFTGMLFLKRQWLLGRRYGFVTPAEMFDQYFQSVLMRYLVVMIATLFSITYLAVQLKASGLLVGGVIGGMFGVEAEPVVNVSMWIFAVVLAGYVAMGGIKSCCKSRCYAIVLIGNGDRDDRNHCTIPSRLGKFWQKYF